MKYMFFCNTHCRQSYHPAAQDWLPTEAKQGWAWSVPGWETSWENVSGYYRNLGSLRAGTRHHGETLLLAHASLTDWPIVAKHANMPSSRGSINAEPATITSESDTERSLAGRAVITAIELKKIHKNLSFHWIMFPISGYDSNRRRSLSSFHETTLCYGNAIQSRRERGYGQPVPVTQRGSIPTNNGAHRAGSQLIGGDKPMSAYTTGILNLHIWQEIEITWTALRAGQNSLAITV